MKTKKAISLIVLVITIIVMIILAGAIVVTLMNNGIIDRAQDAVEQSNLKSLQELATVGWSQAYMQTTNVVKDDAYYQTEVEYYLKANGFTEQELDKYSIIANRQGVQVTIDNNEGEDDEGEGDQGGTGDSGTTPNPELNPSGTIPEGAYYANLSSGALYETMPDSTSPGDVYIFGDYFYQYNASSNGWEVSLAAEWLLTYFPDYPVTDKVQVSYDAILESINNVPVYMLKGTFGGCTSMSSAPEIPYTITTIGEGAFTGCTALTNITIPDGVAIIEQQAFTNCTNLTSITIPDSVTSIGQYVFCGCTNLANITIPENVTSISRNLFSNCTSLTEITILGDITSVGSNAFNECTNLTAITIPDTVTIIEDRAFFGCTSLTSITIPENVTIISGALFQDCTGLTEITILGDITSIRYDAFNGCANLAGIIIPNSVTDIGDSAFKNCTSLTNITFEGTVEQWNNISKNDNWNEGVSATGVTCSNGTVSFS